MWLWIIIVIIPFIGNMLIYLILFEIGGDFHSDIYLYCIYVIHIHTKSAFLHLHFLSSHWAVAFTVAKSFVHAMSCHIQLIIFPYITKRWWYCRCGLWACSSDICSSYFFRRSKVWSILHHGLVGPSSE